MKSLIPRCAKSIFDQNRVTNITTFLKRMHWKTPVPSKLLPIERISDPNHNEQREDIINSILSFPCAKSRRVYKLAPRNAIDAFFFSEVTKVDLEPFRIKLFIYWGYL